MNILLDELPEYVTIDGKEYFIDTDFRTFIIYEMLLNRNEDDRATVEAILDLFYTEEIPLDYSAALHAILDIYRCGQPEEKTKKSQKNGNVFLRPKMIYDYEFDAPYIYGAFLSQYNIDLNEIEYLHWWKFQALFRSLNSSNKIVEIMGYRAVDLGQIKDTKEQARIAKLQQIYAIPSNMTTEEKVAQAGAAFGGGFF